MEVVNSLLVHNGKSIAVFLSIATIVLFGLWFYVFKLTNSAVVGQYINYIIGGFTLYGIFNVYSGSSEKFCYYTFVVGSFIYIVLFLSVSYFYLKKEALHFFQSNAFLLLFSPVCFFMGMSFMFSFNSRSITSYTVFNDFELYTLINYFVNFIFYFILNLYIYKERKLKNA